jgi:antitoxin ParD1/3/4
MSASDDLTIQLRPGIAALVRAAVATGDYTSENDVVESALLAWADDEMVERIGVDRIRELCQEGIASGPGRFASIDEIKVEARRGLETPKEGA